MPLGTYGSPSSPATNKDAHFSGTGTVTVNHVNEPPKLQATLAGSSLQLTADDDATWFTLNPATNLAPPVNWLRDTNTAVFTNNQWHVTRPVPTNGQRFFRLQTS
jgi:hypothetical protein